MIKKIILLAIFLPIMLSAFPQGIAVKTFRLLENDLTARTQSVLDQNGEKCALIKVVTTETGFSWDVGMAGIVKTERKTGEYWLYVPWGVKAITVKHDKLGVLRQYQFGIPIEKAKVYEMVLTTDKVETVVTKREIPTQWVMISSEPSGADVYINDEYKGQTPWQGELEEGEYSYRIEKNLYYPDAGKFQSKTDGEKVEISAVLKPNYGFISITSEPSGAEVRIDDQLLADLTPIISHKNKSGNYQLKLSHSVYHDTIIPITISDQKTTELNIKLRPAFATLEIKAIPEINAEIYIDDKPINKNTPALISPMQTGKHTLMLRNKWYEPQKQIIELCDGEQKKLKVEMKPVFGVVHVKTDNESEIFIDGELKGKTAWEGRLINGLHSVEIKKDKYHIHTEKIDVKAGEEHNIEVKLKPKTGTVKVVGKPFKAIVFLDEAKIGVTPLTKRDLLIGTYQLKVELKGYATFSEKIEIEEDTTVNVKYSLASGRMVFIDADKKGASIFLNKEKVGETPLKQNIPYGNHELKIVSSDLASKQIINVTDDNYRFNIKLKHKKHPYILYNYGLSLSNSNFNTPIGLKFGYLSKLGFYANIDMNKDFKLRSKYEMDRGVANITDLNNTYYLISDEAKYPAFVGIVGGSLKIAHSLHGYVGVGYGYTKRYLKAYFYDENTNEIKGSEYVNVKVDEVSEAVLDFGFVLRYKYGVLNLGYNTLKYINVGVGVNF